MFYNQYANTTDVTLFAVSYDPLERAKLIEIRDKYDMQFPLLNPQKTHVIPIQTPQYLPATFIISPNGDISKPLLGEQTAKSLALAVEQLKQAL
jgi:peroxiredoxin